MKCRRARHLLFDFVDGLGSETLRVELDRHLADCPACDGFAREMTSALALARRTPAEHLDETFNWKVRLAIHRERNAIPSRSASASAWARAWHYRYAASAGVAFALVMIAGGTLVYDGTLETRDRDVATSSAARTGERTDVREAPPLVPSRGAVTNPFRSVSVGAGSPRATNDTLPLGAIDPSASEAAIDSLIEAQLFGLSPEEQKRFLARRIHRLESLRSQPGEPVRP